MTADTTIGIVGLGTIGRIHAERLANLGADLAGADLAPEAREAFAKEFDAPTYESHEVLLETGVDAVVIGVPNRVHEEIAVDALAADTDVLIEKPLAHTVESAELIARAARHSEGFCTVGFTMRYSPLTERVLELRESGRFGSISHVGVDYLRRGGVPGGGRGWFTDPDLAGGGVLMDLGVHIIDLALYVMGYPEVEEVSGQTRSEFGEYAVEDSSTALLRCAGGRTISVDTSWHGTAEPSRDCVVRGTEAGAAFSVTDSDLTFYDANSGSESETVAVETGDMHLSEDRAFLESVAGEREPEDTVEEALTVQRVIDAIYESSDRGEAVAVEGVGR